MIDSINKILTLQQRKEIIKRALYSNPYFYKLQFDILDETLKTPQYGQSLGINRDFYLTEIMSNFSDVYFATGSLFNISIYTAFLQSIYQYTASRLLPSSFISQDGRLDTPIVNEIYDDRQFELFPIRIKPNDKIFADIRNISDKTAPTTGYIVFKGFNTIDNIFVAGRELEQINKSLDEPSRYQYFDLEVTHTGLQGLVKQNDNYPRVILGFGITNDLATKTGITQATATIKDLSRKISLTDTEIPLQFIAPRMINAQDTHIYYLPIEYYWQPFGNLEFNINNLPSQELSSFKISILTRTV